MKHTLAGQYDGQLTGWRLYQEGPSDRLATIPGGAARHSPQVDEVGVCHVLDPRGAAKAHAVGPPSSGRAFLPLLIRRRLTALIVAVFTAGVFTQDLLLDGLLQGRLTTQT